jgi:hypothetical protein
MPSLYSYCIGTPQTSIHFSSGACALWALSSFLLQGHEDIPPPFLL